MLKLRELLVVEHGSKFVVIGGNMRLRACKELGMETVPCKVLPADTPVAKLREYAIKDNNGFGEDDWDILANEWDAEELQDWGMELPMDWDVDGQGDVTATEDDFDESEVTETICKRGEVWKLGEHRLMCGDSTNADDVARLMDGERADITFSSPPYNMMASGFDKALKSGKVNVTYQIQDGTYNEFSDNLSDEDYADLLDNSMKIGLANSDDVLFNIGILASSKHGVLELLSRNKKKFCDILVWNKDTSIPLGLPSNRGMVSHRCELIFCFNQSGNRAFSHPQWRGGKWKGEMMINRIDSKNNSDNEYAEIHHATFPVEFAAKVVEAYTEKSVLDLFGGTGTTMIAAEQLGRKCYMMELDPHYCDVIIARWEKLTGQKAERIET
jgi:DNA modification methylase